MAGLQRLSLDLPGVLGLALKESGLGDDSLVTTMDGKLGILVVEDERQLSRAISRTLRARGYDVVAAPTAAMARVLACQFRVGVFDIDLGDECGVDLAIDFLRDGRVDYAVFFTATVDEKALDRAREVGPIISKREGIAALLPVLSGTSQLYVPRESGVVPCVDLGGRLQIVDANARRVG